MIPDKMLMMMQVNTEPTISRSIKLIVRPGAEGGMRLPEKVSGNYFDPFWQKDYIKGHFFWEKFLVGPSRFWGVWDPCGLYPALLLSKIWDLKQGQFSGERSLKRSFWERKKTIQYYRTTKTGMAITNPPYIWYFGVDNALFLPYLTLSWCKRFLNTSSYVTWICALRVS